MVECDRNQSLLSCNKERNYNVGCWRLLLLSYLVDTRQLGQNEYQN
jgi:hypothetical protein